MRLGLRLYGCTIPFGSKLALRAALVAGPAQSAAGVEQGGHDSLTIRTAAVAARAMVSEPKKMR